MPIPVNSSSSHAMQLLDLPQYLAITSHQQYYLTLRRSELALCRHHSYHICNFNKVLLLVTKFTCTMSLFANNKQSINSLCNFRFVPHLLNPTIIERSSISAFIYNSRNLQVQCPQNKTVLPGCSMCIINLPCKCSVTTNDWFFPPRLVNVNNFTKL